ncbi:MAG: hypothetical protein M3Y52_04065 [Actinomycetota bacterium]|nr:hypothetical protein [Actinomycetota bacterium]
MNVRAFLIVPAAIAVAVLAGCGQADGGSKNGSGSGSGSARVSAPSSEVCNAPAWIRDRAPEGLCTDGEAPVADNLSPIHGRQ